MNPIHLRLAATSTFALALIGIAAAQSDFDTVSKGIQWNAPNIFNGRLMDKGISLDGAEYYAGWKGRKLQLREATLTLTPVDWLRVWYSKQSYFAKGASGASRLDLSADTYGIRGIVRQPDEMGSGGIALQFEAFRPTDATGRVSGSAVRYTGTRDLAFTVMGSMSKLDYQLQYTSVKANQGGDHVDVGDLGLGQNMQHGKFRGRLEEHLFAEKFTTAGDNSTRLKPVIYGRLGYDITSNISLEGDGTAMISGMPAAGGRFTGIGSFLVYNPGGAVDTLKDSFIALGSLRLMFHTSF